MKGREKGYKKEVYYKGGKLENKKINKMKIKDLIAMLESIENKDKEITLLGNETNGDDEDFDISFSDLEIWNDGDESITIFLTK
jgi:hypothetical protein